MKAGIKSMKAPPLLNPAPDELYSWARMTREDERLVRGDAKPPMGREFELKYIQRQLGLDVEVTAEDVAAERKGLDFWRGLGAGGIHLGSCLLRLKSFGIMEEITESDRRIIKQALTEYRGGLRVHIGEVHYIMRDLGFGEEVTSQDRDMMREELSDKGGRVSAYIYGYMKKLGLPAPMDQAQVQAMRDELEEYRREKNGWNLAVQLFYLQNVFPPFPMEGGFRQESMPPLKRFGGGG